MATPTFTLGGNVLTFPQGIQLPSNKPLAKLQVADRTAGGTLQIEDLGAQFQRFVLTFMQLPTAKYNALVNWFDNISDGMVNSFTYEDELANSYTVKIVQREIDFLETRIGFFDGELILEVV